MKWGCRITKEPKCGPSSTDISEVPEIDRKLRSELLSPRVYPESNCYSLILFFNPTKPEGHFRHIIYPNLH